MTRPSKQKSETKPEKETKTENETESETGDQAIPWLALALGLNRSGFRPRTMAINMKFFPLFVIFYLVNFDEIIDFIILVYF
jgi:hypothetical protein